MEVIKEIVKNVMQALETKEKTFRDDPGHLIKKIFSKKEQKHIKLDSFRKGVLSIRVDSSCWLYHLNLQKEDLLDKLRKEPFPVKDIRFHLGEIR